ncbi:hypothetical protein F4776DRAFT_673915 [Hypoxylon sp. NC0597]|nr:hypothetical protein F4776DRAFT_673915 [Hypoxylon sp. NC0597]
MAWTYNTSEGTETEGPKITIIAIAFTGFSLILVCLRMYVRIWIVKGFGNDDWMIIISWVAAFVASICAVVETKYGLGLTRPGDMPPKNIYGMALIQYVGAPFYIIGVWGFKMSLLLCYLRFFPWVYRRATITIAILCTVGHVAFACVSIFLCTPINKQWDPNVTWGRCGNAITYYLSMSWITIFFDLMVIGLPFPILLKSKIPRRRKGALLVLFALGIFVTATQIVRIHMINTLHNYVHFARAVVWSIIETNVGIMTTSLPTLAPLFNCFSEKARTSRKPESQYAMHPWRDGMHELRSHGDHQIQITGLSQGDSTEAILDVEGIMKRVDVVITRQNIHGSDTRQSGETMEEELGVIQRGTTSASVHK